MAWQDTIELVGSTYRKCEVCDMLIRTDDKAGKELYATHVAMCQKEYARWLKKQKNSRTRIRT